MLIGDYNTWFRLELVEVVQLREAYSHPQLYPGSELEACVDVKKAFWIESSIELVNLDEPAVKEEMIQVEDEHKQESAIPLSREQMSVKVLKKRSGYVKALGLRPSSSNRTTSESTTIHKCVTPRDEVKRHKMRPSRIFCLLEANKQQQMCVRCSPWSSWPREMKFEGYVAKVGTQDYAMVDYESFVLFILCKSCKIDVLFGVRGCGRWNSKKDILQKLAPRCDEEIKSGEEIIIENEYNGTYAKGSIRFNTIGSNDLQIYVGPKLIFEGEDSGIFIPSESLKWYGEDYGPFLFKGYPVIPALPGKPDTSLIYPRDKHPFKVDTNNVEAGLYDKDLWPIKIEDSEVKSVVASLIESQSLKYIEDGFQELNCEVDDSPLTLKELAMEDLKVAPAMLDDLKAEVKDLLEDFNVGTEEDPKILHVCASLPNEIKDRLKYLLSELKYCFAWDYPDMPSLDSLVEHRIPIKENFVPYQ
ncbi:hypothetical protein RHSIM_Rhsim10G0117300 [Rhododendron simsii]|uniref:Uncharacterized protein n=1 Tax=Rhododendron simsii TaxID=118357 RepID=A0A834LDV0_RHOSS|nr:hypothetical protein RHSIM_Rhsim10G0117300 [Rhododendron simsii]